MGMNPKDRLAWAKVVQPLLNQFSKRRIHMYRHVRIRAAGRMRLRIEHNRLASDDAWVLTAGSGRRCPGEWTHLRRSGKGPEFVLGVRGRVVNATARQYA